jgi:hypothetical protein
VAVDLAEALVITGQVTRVLEALEIDYLLGGSLASSIHGFPRSTQDIDLVADLRPEQVDPLAEALQADFYLDDERIRSAVRRRASFNLIHLATMTKVDVFVMKGDPGSRLEMERRRSVATLDPPLFVASPEDVVLHKLRWYRLGNEVSDRQWQDVLGVLKVQRGRLDLEYLHHGADRLEVEDLLERALSEAATRHPSE